MNPAIRLAMPLAFVAAWAATAGGEPPAPQPPLAFTRGLQGTFNADWQGVAGRAYFMEWSLDLGTWTFAPFIDFGEGAHGRGLESDADRFFVRLRYGDFENITSLDEAMAADFDGDGLSNIFEVTFGYDPFEDESTIDGPDASLDPDGDGLGNFSEQAAGSDPLAEDNPLVQLEVTVE